MSTVILNSAYSIWSVGENEMVNDVLDGEIKVYLTCPHCGKYMPIEQESMESMTMPEIDPYGDWH